MSFSFVSCCVIVCIYLLFLYISNVISMQTRLYIANPKPCFSKKNLKRGKLHRHQKNHIFIDRITEFSFIIFSDFIHFMKCSILSTMDYHLFFFSLLPIIYCILLFVLANRRAQSVRLSALLLRQRLKIMNGIFL